MSILNKLKRTIKSEIKTFKKFKSDINENRRSAKLRKKAVKEATTTEGKIKALRGKY